MNRGKGLWSKIKEFLYGALDIPYISAELRQLPRPLLVHVSDTPSMSYSYLARLLRRIGPEYIVHTGDIVDEVKLEFAPAQVGEYRSKLSKLLQLFRELGCEGVYLVPGNHDNRASMREIGDDVRIVEEGESISLRGRRLRLDHQFRGSSGDADFHLFGHNPDTGSDLSALPPLLNGLEHIHVISLSNGRVYTLPYPAGTDNARKLLMPKIGM